MPLPPTRPSIGPSQIGDRWITINWQPGNDGYGPIRNFTIQLQKGDEEDFHNIPDYVEHNITSYTITGSVSSVQSWIILSMLSVIHYYYWIILSCGKLSDVYCIFKFRLKPDKKYRFQIAAYNDLGLSPYSSPSEQVTTKQAGKCQSKNTSLSLLKSSYMYVDLLDQSTLNV